jgi:hypothetical protein
VVKGGVTGACTQINRNNLNVRRACNIAPRCLRISRPTALRVACIRDAATEKVQRLDFDADSRPRNEGIEAISREVLTATLNETESGEVSN